MPDRQYVGTIKRTRAPALWDFYNGRALFESGHAAALIFCFDVTRRH